MRPVSLCAALAAALLVASPVFAAPLGTGGITPQQVAQILQARGWPATITKDDYGDPKVDTSANGQNFSVWFYSCQDNRCRSIQFAAGWSTNAITVDKINEWDTKKRWGRSYVKPGSVWVEEDVAVYNGSSTENINEYLDIWVDVMRDYKAFMGL